jgi:hypothetical protein
VVIAGNPTPGAWLCRIKFAAAETFNLSASYFDAGIAATSSYTITARLGSTTISNGSAIFTITYGAGSSTASASIGSYAFSAGNVLELYGAATADATISNLSLNFKST